MTLVTYVEKVTGKLVVFQGNTLTQTPESIFIPLRWVDTDMALCHELFHWIAATDRERSMPNLNLEGMGLDLLDLREVSTMYLQRQTYLLTPLKIRSMHDANQTKWATEWMEMELPPYSTCRLHRRSKKAGVHLPELAEIITKSNNSRER